VTATHAEFCVLHLAVATVIGAHSGAAMTAKMHFLSFDGVPFASRESPIAV